MQLRESLLRRRRALPLLAGVTVLAFAASASAASGEDDETGNASSDTSAEAFVSCMRSNGVADFPDVTVSSDGRINLDYDQAGIDPFDDTYQAALAACESQLPEGSELPAEPDLAAPTAPSDECLPPTDPTPPSVSAPS